MFYFAKSFNINVLLPPNDTFPIAVNAIIVLSNIFKTSVLIITGQGLNDYQVIYSLYFANIQNISINADKIFAKNSVFKLSQKTGLNCDN